MENATSKTSKKIAQKSASAAKTQKAFLQFMENREYDQALEIIKNPTNSIDINLFVDADRKMTLFHFSCLLEDKTIDKITNKTIDKAIDETIFGFLLANQETSVNAKTESQDTPLHYACLGGSIKKIKSLLESKRVEESINAKNSDNKKPIDVAYERNLFVAVYDLLENGSEIDEEFSKKLHDKITEKRAIIDRTLKENILFKLYEMGFLNPASTLETSAFSTASTLETSTTQATSFAARVFFTTDFEEETIKEEKTLVIKQNPGKTVANASCDKIKQNDQTRITFWV